MDVDMDVDGSPPPPGNAFQPWMGAQHQNTTYSGVNTLNNSSMNCMSKQKDEVEEQEEEPQEEVPLDARDALNEIGRLTRRMGGEEDEDMDMRSMYSGAPQPQSSSQTNTNVEREADYGQLPVPAATITDACTAIDELFRLSQQMSNE